jgi:hypothetical protein
MNHFFESRLAFDRTILNSQHTHQLIKNSLTFVPMLVSNRVYKLMLLLNRALTLIAMLVYWVQAPFISCFTG